MLIEKNAAKVRAKAVPGAEFPEIIAETQSYEEVDALEYEISAFVDSVRTGAPPLVTGEDGLKALNALAAQRYALVPITHRI